MLKGRFSFSLSDHILHTPLPTIWYYKACHELHILTPNVPYGYFELNDKFGDLDAMGCKWDHFPTNLCMAMD